ncbi:hypothetical protein QJS04_geneDACA001216 [Acorus gramineus]|uniref:BZIP domain-containing protein n=1 Tax=Acorus gramineus TaxID=55184 RepID=A0AAV9AEU5_ACOGR|nr:hypothetical protein QJS04_geneDACA001216 [Acorus gramineus]
MDDQELDFTNPEALSASGDFDDLSFDVGEFFDTHTCSHTHTCNPPGPDLSHTHTCFHVHTKIVPVNNADADAKAASTEETSESVDKTSKRHRSCGNREAVRKYREKKKARTASLEDEVVQLRAENQQLLKKLQGQQALEAEIMRLRCLLVDIRGRIEGEIGSFPYQRRAMGEMGPNSGQHLSACNLRCDNQVYCMQQGKNGGSAGMNGQGFGVCEIGSVQCIGGSGVLGCSRQESTIPSNGCSSAKKDKGTSAVTES